MSTPRKPRELTGKHVLFCFLGFLYGLRRQCSLGKAATSTFGGAETTSSAWKAWLMFSKVAAAERQDALHWQVDGKPARIALAKLPLIFPHVTPKARQRPG
jgi:hypothetical protein